MCLNFLVIESNEEWARRVDRSRELDGGRRNLVCFLGFIVGQESCECPHTHKEMCTREERRAKEREREKIVTIQLHIMAIMIKLHKLIISLVVFILCLVHARPLYRSLAAFNPTSKPSKWFQKCVIHISFASIFLGSVANCGSTPFVHLRSVSNGTACTHKTDAIFRVICVPANGMQMKCEHCIQCKHNAPRVCVRCCRLVLFTNKSIMVLR